MKKFSIAMLSMVLAGSMMLTGCGGSKAADSTQNGAQDSTAASDTTERHHRHRACRHDGYAGASGER